MHTNNLRSNSLSCIDLFAGAGGFAEGYRQASWSILAGNDCDKAAAETFKFNFPNSNFVTASIEHVTASDLLGPVRVERGELDCLIGGPPCQSFSYNNHQRSSTNERASLFRHYLRLVDNIQPKTIVMENVPGMLTIGDGSVITEICSSLKALGYSSKYLILKAENYGVPQLRRRVFIFASRVGDPITMVPKITHWCKDLHGKSGRPGGSMKRPVNVRSAIGDLPSISNGGGATVMDYEGRSPNTVFQKQVRRRSHQLYNHLGHKLGPVNLERVAHIPTGGNWRDIPREKLPAGMQRARLSDHTKRYGRLCWTGYSSTILTKCDPHWGCYLHPSQDRVLSVREAARFQGFPDTFRFCGDSLSAQYAQVGNAVPVQLAKAVAASVAVHLRALGKLECTAA